MKQSRNERLGNRQRERKKREREWDGGSLKKRE